MLHKLSLTENRHEFLIYTKRIDLIDQGLSCRTMQETSTGAAADYR